MAGKEVWVVKNSWGTGWGDNGLFYVAMGNNDFCIEQYAYTVIPKDYDGSIAESSEKLVQNDFKIQQDMTPIIVWSVVGGVVGLALISWICYIIWKNCKKKPVEEQELLYLEGETHEEI